MIICKKEELASETEREPLAEHWGKRYYCGFGKFRPNCLQVFATAKFFTFILCINALIEGSTATGFTSVVISTIEKRYGFSSFSASLIVITFDITVLSIVTFVSYFGDKAHKPRWLGISCVIQGTGALIFALPHFIFGKYDAGIDSQLQFESCLDENYFEADCGRGNTLAYAFFIIGRMVIAIGASSLFTVGTSFIDDIVHPKYVSIHLGTFYSMGIIGPAVGYGIGGGILLIYVNPWESTTLKESEPGWVGAWWLCFVIGGIASYLIAIPFLMFPRLLPNSHIVMEARKKEMAEKYRSKYGEEKKLSEIIKSFPAHFAKLLKSPTWLFVTIGATCLFFAFDGIVAFAPKYFEAQYRLKPSSSSLLVGAIAVPAGGLGVLVGATIVYFIRSKGKKAASIIWITCLCALPISFLFLSRCNSISIAGINSHYLHHSAGSSSGLTLEASCNRDCNCTNLVYEPVCGADGLTYFSPCRAGCNKYYSIENPSVFQFVNCSCVLENMELLLSSNITTNTKTADGHRMNTQPNSSAEVGICDGDCLPQLVLFTSGVALMIFLVFVMKIPSVLITLRHNHEGFPSIAKIEKILQAGCQIPILQIAILIMYRTGTRTYLVIMKCVADEQRTLALGVQSVVFRLFGSVPGPIIFGIIFDTTCTYWQDICGTRGNCWIYDGYKLSMRSIITSAVGMSLNFLFSFIAWLYYPSQTQSEKNNSGKISSDVEDPTSPLNMSNSSTEGSEDSVLQMGLGVDKKLLEALDKSEIAEF